MTDNVEPFNGYELFMMVEELGVSGNRLTTLMDGAVQFLYNRSHIFDLDF